MTSKRDVNAEFKAQKQGQIAAARDLVARNRADIASYDSGAAQAALDARLADQVAQGKIKMVSPDRYLVLEGWDANEEFTVQRATRPYEIPLILPQTGLDYVNGEAQLYLADAAWHEVGTVIAGGTSDIQKVVEVSGGGYLVQKVPVNYFIGGQWHTDPDKFENVRIDLDNPAYQPLGVVGNIYQPVQNIEAVAFLQELVDDHQLILTSAGPLRGGKKFFVCARLPEDVVIDADGIDAHITPFLAGINSHDGTTPFQVVATPWNVVCGNTERFALRDAITRWSVPHTTNALKRIEEARTTLGLTLNYYKQFEAEENQLARIDLQLNEFDKIVASLWPVAEDAPDRAKVNESKRLEQLHGGFARDSARYGRNAFAAERTFTDFIDHSVKRYAINGSMAAAYATAALEGADDALKSKAHRQLLKLKNR